MEKIINDLAKAINILNRVLKNSGRTTKIESVRKDLVVAKKIVNISITKLEEENTRKKMQSEKC